MPNIACLGEIRQVWDNQYDLSPPGNAAAQVFSGTVSRMTMSVIIRERDYCNCFIQTWTHRKHGYEHRLATSEKKTLFATRCLHEDSDGRIYAAADSPDYRPAPCCGNS
jgi:hypothetical protein